MEELYESWIEVYLTDGLSIDMVPDQQKIKELSAILDRPRPRGGVVMLPLIIGVTLVTNMDDVVGFCPTNPRSRELSNQYRKSLESPFD